MTNRTTYTVNPARLGWHRNANDADIDSSYSADAIAEKGIIRKPFHWQGSLWVAVAMWGQSAGRQAKAYRLLPERLFEGRPTTYGERFGTPKRAEAARGDVMGAYHGMSVKRGRETFVLCGPPAIFLGDPSAVGSDSIPASSAQLDLFDPL